VGTEVGVQRGAATGVTIGKLVGSSADGRLLVAVPGERGKIAARTILPLDSALRRAVLERREVLVVFEGDDPRRPIVTGIVRQPTLAGAKQGAAAADDKAPGLNVEVDADGRRVKLTAKDEIVFECGSASITLRRNGRVIIKGAEVDSISAGTNRIRGGQVRLN
jgi:hypothetical protein